MKEKNPEARASGLGGDGIAGRGPDAGLSDDGTPVESIGLRKTEKAGGSKEKEMATCARAQVAAEV
jgi:hypothetical protein